MRGNLCYPTAFDVQQHPPVFESIMIGQPAPAHGIGKQLRNVAVVGVLLLLIVAVVTGVAQGWRMAGQCLLQSALLWVFAWHQAWQRRSLNHDVATTLPFARLGWANHLTLLRGLLIAAVGGFLFQNITVALITWLSALLYTVAALLDRVDGFIARRSRQTTRLGSELDTVFDALGLAIAPLLAVGFGKVHWSYLLVSLAYYLFQGGLYWRRRHGQPVYAMTPSTLRRTVAGFQMGFVALALWPVFHAELTRVASFAFMLPLLTGFVIDWLTITGRIRPEHATVTALFGRLARFSATVLQPLVRITLAVMLLWLAHVANGTQTDGNPTWRVLLFVHGLQASALLLAVGLVARIGALIALLLLAWLLPIAAVNVLSVVVVCCAVSIALLGAGRFSISLSDDVWINRHDGA
jgi:CDP-diacylglycerol--glycerol-3-phosphate 3-phosphatidyltransferase